MKLKRTLILFVVLNACTKNNGTKPPDVVASAVTPVPSPIKVVTATQTLHETQTFVSTVTTTYVIEEKATEIIDAEAGRFSNAIFRMYDDHDTTYKNLQMGIVPHNPERTLVHFDYHSDLYRTDWHNKGNINIGNYINTMIWKNQIKAVWWILPDDSESDVVLNQKPGCETILSQRELYWGRPDRFIDWQFRDGPPNQIICVADDGAFKYFAGGDCPATHPRKVLFFKRTLGQILRSENAEISGPTILDIDTDFFDNSGIFANENAEDPNAPTKANPQCYSTHYSPEGVEKEFARFAFAITRKMKLRPDYIGAARSPNYTVQNKEKIFAFMEYIGSKAKKE